MNLHRKRTVKIVEHSLEVREEYLRLFFRFDVPDVVFGEVSYLTGKGSEALITRALVEYGWLSSTLEEQIEHSTSIVFSRDGRSVEFVCKRRTPVNQNRFLQMVEKFRLAKTEGECEEAEPC